MKKITVSARIDEDLYDYYKGLGIPLSMVIESGLVDFATSKDKIEVLNITRKEFIPLKMNWRDFLESELRGFELDDIVIQELLKNDSHAIMAIQAFRKVIDKHKGINFFG